jgi:hypothetical protein
MHVTLARVPLRMHQDLYPPEGEANESLFRLCCFQHFVYTRKEARRGNSKEIVDTAVDFIFFCPSAGENRVLWQTYDIVQSRLCSTLFHFRRQARVGTDGEEENEAAS